MTPSRAIGSGAMSTLNELYKKRIAVTALKPGMFVCELDRPWSETPFLFQGFPLLSEDDVLAVQLHCEYVFIDESRAIAIAGKGSRLQLVPQDATGAEAVAARNQLPQVSLAEEAEHAGFVHAHGKAVVEKVFDNILSGHAIRVQDCRLLVRQCVSSLVRNENALIWFSRLKSRDEYTALHCLSVSVLAAGFARYLGHSDSEVEEIGLAGLLHDVGKIKLDQTILNKPERLSPDEFEHVKLHASIGFELLSNESVGNWPLVAARSHHERLDGRGYPQGLAASDIPYIARLIAVVDCYDAITSHRVYDAARSTNKAFRILMEERGRHFDSDLVEKFIEWIGVYPVGSIVELHNGEIGVVVAVNRQSRLKPAVLMVRDELQLVCEPRFVDLSVQRDRNGQPYRIRESHPNQAFGIDIQQFERQGLFTPRYLTAAPSSATG